MALAGAIMPGVARFIVTLSVQADVLGVGTTSVLMLGSMLVSASCPTGGWITPVAGLLGISAVESGRAAPLIGGPPGVELQTVIGEAPAGGGDNRVPVALLLMGAEMVPGAAETDIAGAVELPIGTVAGIPD